MSVELSVSVEREVVHAGGHAHAAQFTRVSEHVRPHAHRGELFHSALLAPLVLEPDLPDGEDARSERRPDGTEGTEERGGGGEQGSRGAPAVT